MRAPLDAGPDPGLEFLLTLFDNAPGVVELRAFPSRQRIFAPRMDLFTLLAFIEARRETEDVYVGVATRRDETSGKLENCLALGAAYIDVDFKTTPEPAARQRLADFPCPPSLVVASGHGLHAYWLFREPSSLPEAERRIRELLERLALQFGGDSSVAEPARILRVPGTWNHKTVPPVPVVLESCDPTRRYNPSELEAWLPPLPMAPVGQGFQAPDEPIGEGQRHGKLYALARALKVKNLSPVVVLAALREFNAEKCTPPLPDAEVERQVESAFDQSDRPGFEPRPVPPIAPPDPVDAAAGPVDAGADPRPTLRVAQLDLQPLRRTMWDLVVRANDPPTLFTSGVRLARVRRIPEFGRVIMDEHTFPSFQGCLADVAKFDGGEKRPRLIAPPAPLVATMLADGAPPVPALIRIVAAPLVAPDGTVVTGPGYHAGTRAYYAPAPGFEVGPVAEAPSAADLAWARAQWLEMVQDFPFATPSDRTHALCAGLTPFGRDLIDGPTPIHLFEAPLWGSGKSLLATAVFFPFLGDLDSVQPEPESSPEWRKRLTSLLREGAAVAIIDNAHDELVAGSLMSFVTSQFYQDRLLGKTRTGHYVNRLVLAITGNNPILSGEALRRTVRIRLIPDSPHPWLRDPTTFVHSDLAGWLRSVRPALVRAALLLWRGWIAAGRPGPGPTVSPFGKFEAWRHALGGLCAVAELPGFLGNAREFYRETPILEESTATFVLAWWIKYRQDLVPPVPPLFDLAQEAGLGFDARTAHGEKVAFGKWLVRLRDRRFAVSDTQWVTVVRTAASHGGVRRWRLEAIDPPDPGEPAWVRDVTPDEDARDAEGGALETHQSHRFEVDEGPTG
jgi:hypothetical protein